MRKRNTLTCSFYKFQFPIILRITNASQKLLNSNGKKTLKAENNYFIRDGHEP